MSELHPGGSVILGRADYRRWRGYAVDIDYLVKIAAIVGPLLQGVCWPVVIFVIFLYYRRTLKSVFEDARTFSFKAGLSGIEASVERRIIEASAYLGAAEANRASGDASAQDQRTETVAGIADVLSKAVTPEAVRRLSSARVLWVDDRPANNIYERRSLEALGIRVDLALSTDNALEAIQRYTFDVIITDMGRPPDMTAGYSLLAQLQKREVRIPVIVYAGSNKPEHKTEASKRGAIGSTNDPRELLQLVLQALLTH